ncbi:MAG: hypothetical protein WDN08_04575 [Rhizomicrobium sp.]
MVGMKVTLAALVIAVASIGLACSSSSTDQAAGLHGPPPDYTFGHERPLKVLHVPDSYDASVASPLVVVLHGYGVTGTLQDAFFNLGTIAERERLFIMAPDGTPNSHGKQFWECDRHVLRRREVGSRRREVHPRPHRRAEQLLQHRSEAGVVVGHSNGGSMAFRMACDASERIAASADLAGPYFLNQALCQPKTPVSILHMHGTSDTVVPYQGGPGRDGAGPFVPAINSVTAWAGLDHCNPTPDTSAPPIDLDGDVPGAETNVSRYVGCTPGIDVELWTMQGSPHVPFNMTKNFPDLIFDFLSKHPKS